MNVMGTEEKKRRNYIKFPTKHRGALIILEGCDRTGKTTQANMLVKSLVDAGKPNQPASNLHKIS